METVQFSDEIISLTKNFDDKKNRKLIVRFILVALLIVAGYFVFKAWWGVFVFLIPFVIAVNVIHRRKLNEILNGHYSGGHAYNAGMAKEAKKVLAVTALYAAQQYGHCAPLRGILTDLSSIYINEGELPAAATVHNLIETLDEAVKQ